MRSKDKPEPLTPDPVLHHPLGHILSQPRQQPLHGVVVDQFLRHPLVLAGTTHREQPRLEIIRMVGELVSGKDYEADADHPGCADLITEHGSIYMIEPAARRVK